MTNFDKRGQRTSLQPESGKRELIAEIYKRYFSNVQRYFQSYTHDAMRAEDMTQDLFIRLMGYESMIVEETAYSFVFTIARRMIVDDARHQAFMRKATDGYLQRMEGERFWQDSETIECRQIAEMERAALRRLPQKTARVYSLTRFEEKTPKELSEQLGISKRTVEYHLFVSRKEVRRMVRKAINQ